MSAEATGWVFRHSPATGARFAVHLAVADSANDQHSYELWMAQGRLAEKARVSRRAAGEALQWLCDEGLLVLLEEGKTRGRPNRYRLLMPELEVAYDTRGGATTGATPNGQGGATDGGTGVRTQVAPGVTHGGTGVLPQVALTQEITQGEPKREPKGDADAFERFWQTYPRKTAKGAARKAWPAAVRAAGAAERIIDGAARYAADPNREPRYTAHASTWLRAERWDDDPLPGTRHRGGQRAPIDTERDQRDGRMAL